MFVTKKTIPQGLRPATSQIAPNDWKILSRYWYPVAINGEVRDTPVKGKLLDVDLVVYRVGGEVSVALDVCPHRSIRLSAGQIIDDRLVCPFHGLRFDSAGQCTRIPAMTGDAKVPPTYRLFMVRSEVKHGLVWVCLDDESTEVIPVLTGALESGDERLAYAIARDWPASAVRQVENFFDLAHIPFVHEGTMGVDGLPVPSGKITHTSEGIVHDNIIRDRRMDNGEIASVDMTYIVTLPFVVEMYSHTLPDNVRRLHMFNIPAPISAHESRVYMMFIAPPGANPPKFGTPPHGDGGQIVEEDIAILGHLNMQDTPLDFAVERMNIPGDKIGIDYRKRLLDLGLGGE